MRVLGYVDDAVLAEPTVEVMTERLTNLTDASESEVDMKININMTKTVSQHLHKRQPIKGTESEVVCKESKYKYQATSV